MDEPTNAAPPSTAVGVHDQAVNADINKGPIILPQYQLHKVVGALRITDVNPGSTPDARPHLMYAPDGFNYVQPSPDVFARYTPVPGDYLVFYPDGYMSFSPKAAFEDGYAPLGDATAAHVAEPAADRRWSVKDGQTITDPHTGLTIRLGSYGDHSNSVFLQAAIAPASDEPEGAQARGSTLVFQRNGEVLRILPHRMDAPGLDPADEREPEPEPFQPNPGARAIGAKAGPDAAPPPAPMAPQAPPVGMAPAPWPRQGQPTTVPPQGGVGTIEGARPGNQPPVMKPVQPLDGGA